MGNRVRLEARPSRNIPLSVKRRLWEMPCVICGCRDLIDVDHIIPWSCGGTADESNLQPLCHQCNHKKGDRLTNEELAEWFNSRREDHFAYHRYMIATQYVNPFDKPTFRAWRQSNA